ncbi:MAG: hypothetical protein NZ992_02150 [Candidatus Korarchaeum sp.]|nr:hypothetical protein [Candidatus Korarchaeum sp.]MDW8036339.1 hypothetical protein [Candidatus Korarchaeum sp.]
MRQLSTFLRREELENLRVELGKSNGLLPPKSPWEEFRFFIGQYNGIVYKSGKVVYHEELSGFIESILTEDECVEIGSDEAGKGEITGPIVVAAVALDERGRRVLRARGLLESKSSPKSRVNELANLIREISISYSIKKVSPDELRDIWSRGNLNELLALWHLEVIRELLEVTNACRVIVDSFDEKRLRGTLSKIKVPQVIIESNADLRYSSVAAASILARFEYLKERSSGIKWKRRDRGDDEEKSSLG